MARQLGEQLPGLIVTTAGGCVAHLAGVLGAVVGLIVLVTKIALWMGLFVWVRWTFPRFRYDQLMRLGWKVLLPLAIVNLILVAAMAVAGWI